MDYQGKRCLEILLFVIIHIFTFETCFQCTIRLRTLQEGKRFEIITSFSSPPCDEQDFPSPTYHNEIEKLILFTNNNK